VNAIANRWGPEEVRLWGGSAFGALLLHLVPAALLVLYIHWPPQPQPPAGSRTEMDVELAPAMPSGASPAASSAQAQARTTQAPAKPAQLAMVNPVRPLGEMKPVSQPDAPSSNAAPAANVGAASAPVGTSDLGSAAAGMTLQLWLEEVRARLKSHMEYPDSAIQKMQQEGVMQDTVMLKFSVDHAGKVTYSGVDSEHHYQDLEQETQLMLRLSSALPAPPQGVSPDAVINVPVQFVLELSPILCGGADCPTAQIAQSKPHLAPPPKPTLDSCTAATNPGPAPDGSTATLEQMRTYRDTLNQYLAAGGNQLACLSQVQDVSAPALRDTLARQLHSMVDEFNAQAHQFEAKAQAQALQAQQARERQAQALAAQVYGACTAPPALKAPATLSAQAGEAFRRQLIDYESAVHSYVACLQQADLAATGPARGLASDQRAQLHQSAAQLGNTAIASFNQLAGRFNAQVPQIRKAIATQEQLAEAQVRGTAIFPSSTWDLPVPLPPDECVYIIEIGQSYRAQLCKSDYFRAISNLSQVVQNSYQGVDSQQEPGPLLAEKAVASAAADAMPAEATQQEAIAAQHGFPADGGCTLYCAAPILGIAVTTQAGFAGQVQPSGPQSERISYSVSELRVTGRHIAMTISSRSDNDSRNQGVNPVQFDLVLSPDNQTLHGYCSTEQRHWECVLPRHLAANAGQPDPARPMFDGPTRPGVHPPPSAGRVRP
jgi:TonB family protein